MRSYKNIHPYLTLESGLILLFTTVLLVPNLILAYTEPYSVSTIAASLLLPAAFYLLWGLAVPATAKMVLAGLPLMVLAAFQVVISYLFGNSIIAVDMFTNLFTTNSSEAGELLASIWPSVIFVCVLYLPVLLLAMRSLRKKYKLENVYRRKLAVIALVLLVLGSVAAMVSEYRNRDFAIRYHIFPVNVCYNIKLSVERWKQSKNYFESSEGFRFGAEKERPDSIREVYVLVIGEASRAASWQLFGYDRETTPRLAAMEGIVPFRDVLTQSNTTHKSVPILLSPCSAENYDSIYLRKSAVTLFHEAGFRTAFITNQPANKSLTEFFASEADEFVDITMENGRYVNRYDGELIPEFQRILSSTEEDLFVVLHMYGSHADHGKRYPREFARFLPDEVPSISIRHKDNITHAYDNSIYYTDYVLSEIISLLNETEARSALLFCSDHGEDILDDDRERFLHASPTTTYYQLHTAAFAWFSPEYGSMYPEKSETAAAHTHAATTTAAIFHTLCDMASIRCDQVDPSQSLVSSQWTKVPRMYIDDYNKAVNVLHTGLSELDLQMFDRHGVVYDKSEFKKRKY